jgi:hypothetical protein
MARRPKNPEPASDAAAGLTDPGVQTASSGADSLSDDELKARRLDAGVGKGEAFGEWQDGHIREMVAARDRYSGVSDDPTQKGDFYKSIPDISVLADSPAEGAAMAQRAMRNRLERSALRHERTDAARVDRAQEQGQSNVRAAPFDPKSVTSNQHVVGVEYQTYDHKPYARTSGAAPRSTASVPATVVTFLNPMDLDPADLNKLNKKLGEYGQDGLKPREAGARQDGRPDPSFKITTRRVLVNPRAQERTDEMDAEGVMRPKFKPGLAIDFVHPDKAAEHVTKDADFARMITNKFLVKHGYTGDNRANAPTVAQVLKGNNYDVEDKAWAAKEANGRFLSAQSGIGTGTRLTVRTVEEEKIFADLAGLPSIGEERQMKADPGRRFEGKPRAELSVNADGQINTKTDHLPVMRGDSFVSCGRHITRVVPQIRNEAQQYQMEQNIAAKARQTAGQPGGLT